MKAMEISHNVAVITKKRELFAKGTFPPLSSRQVAPAPLFFCLNIRHVSQQELKWGGREKRKGTGGREFLFYFLEPKFKNEIS